MLPWLVTFHLTRLGFEAQNAAALRFLRLVGNASRTEADEIISDTIAPPLDSPTAAIKVAPKRRRSVSKVYKKPARANKRKNHLSNSAAETALMIPRAFAQRGKYESLKMPVVIIAGEQNRTSYAQSNVNFTRHAQPAN
jgi:hypothetical protein